MPTIREVDNEVSKQLNTLDHKLYYHNRKQEGDVIYYDVYRKNDNAWIGTYQMHPDNIHGGSVKYPDDPELEKIWHSIVFKLIWPMLENKFGKLPWSQTANDEQSVQPGQQKETVSTNQNDDIYIPSQRTSLDNWKQLWAKIKSWVINLSMDADTVLDELRKQKRENRYRGKIPDIRTLRKIIAAGRAGLLDPGISKTTKKA